MARYSKAVWKPISMNYTKVKTAKNCVILHTSASNGDSLHAWFENPSAAASSHFFVRKSGIVEQYIDTAYMSWASGAGNSRSISIETEGLGTEPWTDKQVTALVALCQWICKTHTIPVRQMESSAATEHGIGWHRLGIDGNFPSTGVLRGRTARGGGEVWSSSRGKVCPGDARIQQVRGIVAAVAGGKVTVASAKKSRPHMVSPFEGRLTAGWRGYPLHAGMDIAPPIPGQTGRPVYAAFAGTVVNAVSWAKHGNRVSTWAPYKTGNGVLIKNPDGEAQGYNHMKPCVKVGQHVKQGQVIGHNDTSGNQTGPHLHFECWANASNAGSDYDPARCFRKYGVIVGSKPALTEQKAAKQTTKQKQEEPSMKLVNTLTRSKSQTYVAGRKGSIKLTNKDTITLTKASKGDEIRVEADVYVSGLREGEILDLYAVIVDYNPKTKASKLTAKLPTHRVVGRAGGALTTGHVSNILAVHADAAKGSDRRVRIYAHNRSKSTVTITQVRATAEKN